MTHASTHTVHPQLTPKPGGHGYPGHLIVIEGGDRSGRSTQVDLLVEWLGSLDTPVVKTDWSTSPHISKAIHKAKGESALRTVTFSLFYAADFADRVANVIVPALERGEVVIADRYVYTAFARDSARGADQQWLRKLYEFAPRPDAVFYLAVPPAVRLQREPSAAVKSRDIYEFGLDLGLTSDPQRSFEMYQQRVYDEFSHLVEEFGLTVIDGEQDIAAVHRVMRDNLSAMLTR
jgi:dTMP kinase